MANAFIALQCYQCSTMQVKQQKKSSNKWSCVICFEKQSIRKVYARSFRAKDVRGFVQTFNMSRQISENGPVFSSPVRDFSSDKENDSPAIETGSNNVKRRSDWTEYMDLEEEGVLEEQGLTDNLFEPKIVTELPRETFKKAKLKHSSLPQNNEGNTLFKPTFSKRKPSILPENDLRSRVCQEVTSRKISKWSNYIELDDEEDDHMAYTSERSSHSYDLLIGDNSDIQFDLSDQKVEEDVHPDFK